jgi:N-acetyl-gamma-glutamyl-phosphate reductase
MTIRVAIVGATGYTALESIKILLRHPRVKLSAITSRGDAGTPLDEVHPSLSGLTNLRLEPTDPDALKQTADVVFSCLPHGASSETVRTLHQAGLRVIDFSADFRLSSDTLYRKWYGDHHGWSEKLGNVPYGLPELFASQLQDATLVANPGCYPTSAILPLTPLVKEGVIEIEDIIVDSKSGVSGAGRAPKLGTLYCETNESISAYAVASHRHQPEIEDLVGRASGKQVQVLFTPHLTPMDRGILSTIYVKPKGINAAGVMEIWRTAYAGQPFVRIVNHLPATKFVSGTNFCDMTARDASGRLILVTAIDNLIKGASGAAVQTLNVMYGWEPTLGLLP